MLEQLEQELVHLKYRARTDAKGASPLLQFHSCDTDFKAGYQVAKGSERWSESGCATLSCIKRGCMEVDVWTTVAVPSAFGWRVIQI
jgi:hypothetical protein